MNKSEIVISAQAQRPMDSITSYATNLQIALSLGTMQAHLPLRTQVDNIAQLFTKDLAMVSFFYIGFVIH